MKLIHAHKYWKNALLAYATTSSDASQTTAYVADEMGILIQEYEEGDVRKNVNFQFVPAGVNLERWLILEATCTRDRRSRLDELSFVPPG